MSCTVNQSACDLMKCVRPWLCPPWVLNTARSKRISIGIHFWSLWNAMFLPWRISLAGKTMVFMMTKYGSVLTPNYIQLFRCFLDDWVFIHGQWKCCVACLRVRKSLYWIALSGRGLALSTGSAENGRGQSNHGQLPSDCYSFRCRHFRGWMVWVSWINVKYVTDKRVKLL